MIPLGCPGIFLDPSGCSLNLPRLAGDCAEVPRRSLGHQTVFRDYRSIARGLRAVVRGRRGIAPGRRAVARSFGTLVRKLGGAFGGVRRSVGTFEEPSDRFARLRGTSERLFGTHSRLRATSGGLPETAARSSRASERSAGYSACLRSLRGCCFACSRPIAGFSYESANAVAERGAGAVLTPGSWQSINRGGLMVERVEIER